MIPALIAIGIVAFLYVLFFLENCRFKVTNTTIRHKNVRTPFRIVQVSDLHNKAFGKDNEKLLAAISEAKPDFIVVTGDLFDRHNARAVKNAFAFCDHVVRIAPTYFIEGNHECALRETGEHDVISVAARGVAVLQNASVDLPQCRLIGLCQRAEPDVLSGMLSQQRFNLVLAHRPERFPLYAETGADVILSGHAHGGQVRFGRLSVYAPQQGLFPKYTAGIYRIGASILYVSRGLGNTIAAPRVFNTPELNVLDFQPESGEGVSQHVF